MYPMYSQLSLNTPSLGLRISRIGFRDPGISFARAQEPTNLQPTRMVAREVTPEITLKTIKFQTSLQERKNHENEFKGDPKSCKFDPGIITNPTSAENVFCNTSYAKCLFFDSQKSRFRPQRNQKRKHGNKHGNNSGPKNTQSF